MDSYNDMFRLHAQAVQRYTEAEAEARKKRMHAEDALIALIGLKPGGIVTSTVGDIAVTATSGPAETVIKITNIEGETNGY